MKDWKIVKVRKQHLCWVCLKLYHNKLVENLRGVEEGEHAYYNPTNKMYIHEECVELLNQFNDVFGISPILDEWF